MEKGKLTAYINGFKCEEKTKEELKRISKRKGRPEQALVRVACNRLIQEIKNGTVILDEEF